MGVVKIKRILSMMSAAVIVAAGIVVVPAQAGNMQTKTTSTECANQVAVQSASKSVVLAVGEKYTFTVKTKKAQVKSSNKKVVSAKAVKKGNGKYTYTITAKKSGKATVKYTKNGKTVKKTVIVKNAKLSASTKTLNVGDSSNLTLNTAYGSVKWSSSDTSVVKIKKINKKKVKLTGVSEGTAVVSAKVGTKTVKCRVTVESEDAGNSESVEILVMSDDNVEVYYVGCGSDGLYFDVTNKTDSTLNLAISTVALDGISYDIIGNSCYGSITVSPKSTGRKVQALPDEFSTEFGSMSGNIGYSTDEVTDIWYSFTNIAISDYTAASYSLTGTVIYSDDYIDVYYTECDSEGLHFEILNKTDYEMSFAFSTLALDGISYDIMNSDCYGSAFITQKSIGKMVQAMPSSFSTSFVSLSGELGYSAGELDGWYSFGEIAIEQ